MGAVPLFTTPPWVIGVFYAVLGFLFGVLAERTTYCIVIATHQVMGVRYSRIYEMILTGIAVSSLLTGLLVAFNAVPAVDAYINMPGAGWFTVLGSFIFGFGIMLGQGCMVGMLWKSGQGYVVNWLEILGMMLGTIIFALPIYNGLALEWWWKHTVPWLSIANGSTMNYTPYLISGSIPINAAAAIMGVVFFAAIMLVVYRLRRSRLTFEGGGERLLKSPIFYGVLFGLFMVASFIFLAGRGFNYLGVTTPVGLLAEYLLNPLGIHLGAVSTPHNWFQTVGILNPFTFFVLIETTGAFISSMIRGTFSVKLPPPNTNRVAEFAIAFTGGVILAIGARIAQGCNVGGFWSGLAGLSLFGLLFTVGFIPGTVAGYYTYVALSSKAASLVKRPKAASSIIKLRLRSINLDELIFGLVWSLVLIGVGLEVMGYYNVNVVKLSTTAAQQYGLVLVASGLLTMVLTVAITLFKGFKVRTTVTSKAQ
ncbi:MAG: YeeE/YedE thiosulfate transporter family protein [Vulcanisaeta sp.]|nr:YeeE/YedE thiosulfate transporter family protein [Vulcanisaeta sp.]